MERHSRYLKGIYETADHRIQTDPVCRVHEHALRIPPVSRAPRKPAGEVRSELGVDEKAKLILITLGGVSGTYEFLDRLTRIKDLTFVVPGASDTTTRKDNLILLPRHSVFFHPDLVHSVDAVVGKAGYSTLAEVFAAGIPFGYVLPEGFPESAVLSAFIRDRMPGISIPEETFYKALWVDDLPELLALPKIDTGGVDGAGEAAKIVLDLI
jgi:hypothetical protein